MEELIALGVDVNITVSQRHAEQWTPQDAPCRLAHDRVRKLWGQKIRTVCMAQMALDPVRDSLYGLIHLAVRDRHLYCRVCSASFHVEGCCNASDTKGEKFQMLRCGPMQAHCAFWSIHTTR